MKTLHFFFFLCFLVISNDVLSQTASSDTTMVGSVYCNNISKEVDEFSGEVTYTARVNNDVSFLKIKKGKSTSYYLSIWVREPGIYTGNGVSLILKDGRKINKPSEKVESTYSSGSFYSTAFVSLSMSDIALLKVNGLLKYKIYISKGELDDADYNRDLLGCLVKAK